MIAREYKFNRNGKAVVVPTEFKPVSWVYDAITNTVEFVITNQLSFIAVNYSYEDTIKIAEYCSGSGNNYGWLDNNRLPRVPTGYYMLGDEEIQQYTDSYGRAIKISDVIKAAKDMSSF